MRKVSRIVGLAAGMCVLLMAVAVFVIVFGRMDQTVTAFGQVVPADHVNLAPEVTGIVKDVLVRSGDTVRPGDTLVLLSSDEFRFQTDQAARNLSEARAQLFELEKEYQTLTESESFELSAVLADLEAAKKRMELARRTYARKRELYDKNLISAEELERAELGYDLARSNHRVLTERHKMLSERYERLIAERKRGVELAEEAYELAREKLDKTVLISPIAGTVMTRDAEDIVGTMAKEGEPLLRIADMSRMQFVVMLRESDIAEVWSGLPAEVHISAFPHREYKVFEGNVTEVSSIPTVTESGATYEATIDIDEPWIDKDDKRFHIRPGMSGRVEIVIEPDVRLVTILLDSFDN